MRSRRALGVAALLPSLLVAAAQAPVDAPARDDVAAPAVVSRPAAGAAGATASRDLAVGVEPAGRTVTARASSWRSPHRSAPEPAPVTEPAPTTDPAPAPVPAGTTQPTAEPTTQPTAEPSPDPTLQPSPEPTTAPDATTPPTPGAAPAPDPTPVPEPAPAPRLTVPLGVTVPWGPLSTEALAATSAATGTHPAYLQWYTGFGEAPDVAKLQAVVDAGAVPVVTWEPWAYTDGVVQPRFALATFAAGHHDGLLAQWADALAAWDGPVMLRFAHEMNGSWYPWAAGVNGNTAGDYVTAWRHVHDVFAARGADNVRWVWAPNVVYPGSTPLAALYPGDAYVDVVGVDGYNWGTSVSWETWKTPQAVFGATLAEVRTVAPGKPLLVTETASSELGGDKAAWVGDLFVWAAAQPDLTGIIWFDENKETDWRIASSPESAAAFRDAHGPTP